MYRMCMDCMMYHLYPQNICARLTSFAIIATRLFESITDTIAWTVVVWSTKMTFQVGWWCGVLRGTAEVSYSVIRGGSSSGRCNGKKETRELHVFDMDSSRGMMCSGVMCWWWTNRFYDNMQATLCCVLWALGYWLQWRRQFTEEFVWWHTKS